MLSAKQPPFRRNSKAFLSNEVDEFGSICWHVQPYVYGDSQPWKAEAEVRITDCSNYVVLDFSYCKHETYEKRIKKIDRMVAELESFKSAMIESWGKR